MTNNTSMFNIIRCDLPIVLYGHGHADADNIYIYIYYLGNKKWFGVHYTLVKRDHKYFS